MKKYDSLKVYYLNMHGVASTTSHWRGNSAQFDEPNQGIIDMNRNGNSAIFFLVC